MSPKSIKYNFIQIIENEDGIIVNNNEINKLNDSNISEKMLSQLQSNSPGGKLPGLPGLPNSQNKLSNLFSICILMSNAIVGFLPQWPA